MDLGPETPRAGRRVDSIGSQAGAPQRPRNAENDSVHL